MGISWLYNQAVWVSDDTKYILPALNVDPDTIIATGFSGGAYFGNILHLTNSETIKGVYLRSGGPFSDAAAYDAEVGSGRNYKIIEKAMALAQELSDKGEIDDVQNLRGAPAKIIGGADETYANLLTLQDEFYARFDSLTDLEILEGVGHTTAWNDARDAFSYLYPKIEGTGISSDSDLTFVPYDDLTYQTEGVIYQFDQRTYTTPGLFGKANLGINGYVYAPNRCIDGSVDQCKLLLHFTGCGGIAAIGERSDKKIGTFAQDFGWGAMAHANDVVMLVFTNRDACYNNEYRLFGIMNDPNYLKKDGAQISAVMAMVEQLKKEKDPDLDLANLENIVNPFSDDYQVEPESFADSLGILLGMNPNTHFMNALKVVESWFQ